MSKKVLKDILLNNRSGNITSQDQKLLKNWMMFGEFPELNLSADEIQSDLSDIGARLPITQTRAIRKLWLSRAAAAAAIFLLVGTATYFYKTQTSRQVTSNNREIAWAHISPGGNKAVLTLANGDKIDLSSAKKGIAIHSSEFKYNDGTSVGTVVLPQTASANLRYNEISTPLGGQYQVTLPDGTKVWLNAGSSLKFPSDFNKVSSRVVDLNGEAYFEVSKFKRENISLPFVVNAAGQKITVLGTHFNVSSYADDKETRTTLLEGSVQVVSTASADSVGVLLKPGQQAVLGYHGMRVVAVDVDESVAWKSGYFDFRNESLPAIMRKIARWYDVEIEYEKGIQHNAIYGMISRSKNMQSVLKILELSGDVKFKLEGRRLTVMNK